MLKVKTPNISTDHFAEADKMVAHFLPNIDNLEDTMNAYAGINFSNINPILLDEIAATSGDLSEVLNKADIDAVHKNAVAEIFAAATYELHRRGLLVNLDDDDTEQVEV